MTIKTIAVPLSESEYKNLQSIKQRVRKTWKQLIFSGARCLEAELKDRAERARKKNEIIQGLVTQHQKEE